MKFPKSQKAADWQPMPPGTLAYMLIAHAQDVIPDRLRTYAELRNTTPLPAGVRLPATVNVLAELGTIGEPITFSGTGNGFTRYTVDVNSSHYEDKMTGERQHTADGVELNFEMSLPEAEAIGFKKMVANREMIVVIGDIGSSNDFKIIGSKDIPAFAVDVVIKSGAKPGDKRVLAGKIVESSGRGMFVYPVATLHPAGIPMAV